MFPLLGSSPTGVFPSLGTNDSWGHIILCYGSCPVHHSMLCSIAGLCPLDASSFPSCGEQKCHPMEQNCYPPLSTLRTTAPQTSLEGRKRKSPNLQTSPLDLCLNISCIGLTYLLSSGAKHQSNKKVSN